MKTTLQILISAFALGLVAACGSGEEPQLLECGEGTVLDEEQEICVLVEPDCAPNEVLDAVLDRCVRAGEDYCSDGTTLDQALGQCVADTDLECAANTQEEDGFCMPAQTLSCGAGTVLHDQDCVPTDEICGDGTQAFAAGGVCRPSADVCGEGTVFDTSSRSCVPSSLISCGEATVVVEAQCLPAFTFYDDLAANPDLDLDDPEVSTEIALGQEGDRFAFVGTIEAPKLVDGERVQDLDHLSFDAEAGQWIRVALFSLGLPEPGFSFRGMDNDFYRLSDVGAGLEAMREVMIQEDGTYELDLFNMSQFLGTAPPAGGEDWRYVGYVELMEPPTPQSVDIFEESLQGDIRDLTDNFYMLEDLNDVEQILMILTARPTGAQGELQIWTDATTLHEVHPLDSSSLTLEVPQDTFYLLLDRVHAFGTNTGYAITGFAGEPLNIGGSITEEISLAAGQYVGLSQFNEQGATVGASISTDNTTLATNNQLAVSIAEEGDTALYWYAEEATDVTVTLQNTSSSTIDAVAMSVDVGTADSVSVTDLDLQQISYDQPLGRGQRHYFTVDFDVAELLSIGVTGTSASAYLHLAAAGGNQVTTGTDSMVFESQIGEHLLYVEALQAMGSGFTLEIQEAQFFELSESSSPQAQIPLNPTGVSDTITVNCPIVAEISIDVDLIDDWISELSVAVTDPAGNHRYLWYLESTPDWGNTLVGNFNETLTPTSFQAELAEAFVGTSGTGDWTMTVINTDFWPSDIPGTLRSWGLNLTCEG